MTGVQTCALPISQPHDTNPKEKYPPPDFTFLILILKFIRILIRRGEIESKKGIV